MKRKLALSQTAVTIAALLLSALAARSSKAAPEPAAVAWGEVREGLQAGIRIPSGRLIYRQGEPLRAEIVLRNTTGKSIQVDNYAPIIWGAERLAERIVFRTRDSDAGYAASETFILTAGEVMSAPLASPAVILREPGWTGDASDYTAPTLRLPAGTYQLSASRVLRQGFTDAEELKRGLPTGSLEIKVLSDAPVADSPMLQPFRIAWGAVHEGLQLGTSYTVGRMTYRAGEMVPFTLHVRNTADQPKGFRHWSYNVSDYSPQVLDAKGERVTVRVVRLTIFPLALDRTLKHGESMIVAHPRLELVPPTDVRDGNITPSMPAAPGHYRLSHSTIFGLTEGPEGFTSYRSGELAMEVSAAQ